LRPGHFRSWRSRADLVLGMDHFASLPRNFKSYSWQFDDDKRIAANRNIRRNVLQQKALLTMPISSHAQPSLN
jgi:hypothetical protein